MPIPVVYRNTSSPVLNSYDFVDVATGQAIKTLWGCDFEDGTYKLHGNTVIAYIGGTGSGANGTLDIDFDLAIERQLKIEGQAVIYVPMAFESNSGTVDVTSTVTAYIRKYSGVTETTLVSGAVAVTSPVVVGGESTFALATFNLEVPRTNFKKDDILRLTITTSAPGANKAVILFHDPSDRAGAEIIPSNAIGAPPVNPTTVTHHTALRFDVPIRVDTG